MDAIRQTWLRDALGVDLAAPKRDSPGNTRPAAPHVVTHAQQPGHMPQPSLQAHEAAGGHVLARHVGFTETALLARLDVHARLTGASSFHNVATAESALAEVLVVNAKVIEMWLQGAGSRLRLDASLGRPTGITVNRGTRHAVPVSSARLILVRDPGMPAGYRILTGFPTPP